MIHRTAGDRCPACRFYKVRRLEEIPRRYTARYRCENCTMLFRRDGARIGLIHDAEAERVVKRLRRENSVLV
jgi:hypothetical protein